ncbi:MAG TPA: hypothetical protein VGJ02_06410 [Pyrinomonadaceae bacterium]
MASFTSIPFKTKTDLSQINGVAKFSSAGIVLEFESKFLGLIGTGVKEVRLAIDELLDVKFKKRFMQRNASIEIRTRTFTTLANLPNKNGKLTLKIESDDVATARDAVERLNRDLAEYAASLPPNRVSVSSLFDESEADTRPLPDD